MAPDSSFNHNAAWRSKSVAEAYDGQRFTSLGGRLYDGMEKRAITKLLDLAEGLSPLREVLDLACGTGRISEFLGRRGYQLTCGDISPDMLAVARNRLAFLGDRVSFREVDIYATGLPDRAYDCVTAFRLFQHLVSDERARALREMARLSRRFVLVNVMYSSAYYDLVRRLRCTLGRYTTRYTSTTDEIRSELGFARLRIVRTIFAQPGFNGNYVLLLEKS